MPRGGSGRGSQRGIVLWSLLATPACGLVVGFEPRELCEDCAGSTVAADGSGTSNSSAGGASSTAANTAAGGAAAFSSSSGAADTASAAGGSVSDAGGAGGTNGGTGGTSLENTTGSGTGSGAGGSAGGSAGTGTGGSTTHSDTTAASGGTGAQTASGGSMGGGGGVGGGAGGATSMTITTSTSTTVGGHGGTGTSLCEAERSFDATDNVGSYPAALILHPNNSSRPWDFTWVEDDDVYVSARSSAGSEVLGPTPIDASGTHNASAIATEGQYAYVAYGEFASGTARVVMYRLNPLDPLDMPHVDDTGALDGDTAPRVVGIALRGSSGDALVAAVDANGDGLLALFSNGEYITSQSVVGPLDDLAPVDLGESFAIAYIQDGSLQISPVPYDLSEVGTADEVEDVEPIAPTLGSLRAASTNDGAALVWLESSGVHWVSVDADGDLTEPALVSSGSHVLPAVDALGNRLFASWIDTSTDTLYLRRLLGGSTGSTEPFAVAEGVVDVRYGFAADPFSATPTLAFVYSTDRLRMTIVTCLD